MFYKITIKDINSLLVFFLYLLFLFNPTLNPHILVPLLIGFMICYWMTFLREKT